MPRVTLARQALTAAGRARGAWDANQLEMLAAYSALERELKARAA